MGIRNRRPTIFINVPTAFDELLDKETKDGEKYKVTIKKIVIYLKRQFHWQKISLQTKNNQER